MDRRRRPRRRGGRALAPARRAPARDALPRLLHGAGRERGARAGPRPRRLAGARRRPLRGVALAQRPGRRRPGTPLALRPRQRRADRPLGRRVRDAARVGAVRAAGRVSGLRALLGATLAAVGRGRDERRLRLGRGTARHRPEPASSPSAARWGAARSARWPASARWRRSCSSRPSPAFATWRGGSGFPAFLVRDPFDNLAVVRRFAGPILLLHGERDTSIAPAHAEALHRAAPGSELHLLALRPQRLPPPLARRRGVPAGAPRALTPRRARRPAGPEASAAAPRRLHEGAVQGGAMGALEVLGVPLHARAGRDPPRRPRPRAPRSPRRGRGRRPAARVRQPTPPGDGGC